MLTNFQKKIRDRFLLVINHCPSLKSNEMTKKFRLSLQYFLDRVSLAWGTQAGWNGGFAACCCMWSIIERSSPLDRHAKKHTVIGLLNDWQHDAVCVRLTDETAVTV